jgi:dTDP-4-dehydrorhamnose reductase
MKILITGANGLLGSFLINELIAHGHDIIATGKGESRLSSSHGSGKMVYLSLDITDAVAVDEVIQGTLPEVIIHAAALTQADYCEMHQAECWNVNVTATRFIIESARKASAFLIFVSTDFVFDGMNGPYRESDIPAPVNYYGCSKRVAEKAVMESGLNWSVARTVLVYGNSTSVSRSNIISWSAEKLKYGEKFKVVSDQFRTPTYTGDLAKGLRLIAEQKATGLFHLSGKDLMTPYEMAMQTAEYLGLDKTLIERVDANVFSQPAMRPLRTGFIIDKARQQLGYDPITFTEGLALVLNKNGL